LTAFLIVSLSFRERYQDRGAFPPSSSVAVVKYRSSCGLESSLETWKRSAIQFRTSFNAFSTPPSLSLTCFLGTATIASWSLVPQASFSALNSVAIRDSISALTFDAAFGSISHFSSDRSKRSRSRPSASPGNTTRAAPVARRSGTRPRRTPSCTPPPGA
jgi:hypothetical protein